MYSTYLMLYHPVSKTVGHAYQEVIFFSRNQQRKWKFCLRLKSCIILIQNCFFKVERVNFFLWETKSNLLCCLQDRLALLLLQPITDNNMKNVRFRKTAEDAKNKVLSKKKFVIDVSPFCWINFNKQGFLMFLNPSVMINKLISKLNQCVCKGTESDGLSRGLLFYVPVVKCHFSSWNRHTIMHNTHFWIKNTEILNLKVDSLEIWNEWNT